MHRFLLRVCVLLSCSMCSLSPAYSALSDYFVIGDFKLVPDFSIYSYDMKRVNYYNSGTASTPMLDRVLQTESGRFIHSYKDIGVISYSEELDKLVLTAEPYLNSLLLFVVTCLNTQTHIYAFPCIQNRLDAGFRRI